MLDKFLTRTNNFVDHSLRVCCFLCFHLLLPHRNPALHHVWGCFDKINPQHADELFKFDSVMYEELRERCGYHYRQTPFLQLTEPPVKPITIHTPPAFKHRLRRRRNRSGWLHYSQVAAVKTAAVQRWRWWNLSIHSAGESELLLFVTGNLFCWEEQGYKCDAL